MRILQIGIFILGILSFLSALFFIGQVMGDVLWRVGISALLVDLVYIKLWPYSQTP